MDIYRGSGLLVGPETFPVVADLATLAGPADSTLLLVGLSLPGDALHFQRDGDAFAARYMVALRVARDSQLVRLVDRQETVRVGTFAETTRPDETVIFQTVLALAPGDYEVTLRVRDGLSARGAELRDTIRIPRFPVDRSLADPLPVLAGTARPSRAALPDLVMNPRHTVSYGAADPSFYVEGYGPGPVRLELRSDDGGSVWSADVELEAGAGLAAAVVEIPVDSIPLGSLWLSAHGDSASSGRVRLVVTLGEAWMAANFEQLLSVLRYVAPVEELDALREAAPAERRRLWDAFWADRDPVPATPVNEFREEFFQRIRFATHQFGDPGVPGWLTDRGEVYIVLGRPSSSAPLRTELEDGIGRVSAAEEWVYERVPGGGRLSLVFVDPAGFGAFELTRSSAEAFRTVARRVRQLQER